jgi:hypothetical protein
VADGSSLGGGRRAVRVWRVSEAARSRVERRAVGPGDVRGDALGLRVEHDVEYGIACRFATMERSDGRGCVVWVATDLHAAHRERVH